MSVSPCLDIYSVLVGTIEQQSITVPISFPIGPEKSRKIVETKALIDCGVGEKFIHQSFAWNLGLELIPLKRRFPVRNVDRTLNKAGSIRFKVQLELKLGGRIFHEILLISRIGKQKIILGLPWLMKYNPDIDWWTGEIKWQDKMMGQSKVTDEPDDQEWMNRTVNGLDIEDSLVISFIKGELMDEAREVWINTKVTTSQAFTMKYEEKKLEQTTEEKYRRNIMNIWIFLMKTLRLNSQKDEHGTIGST